MSQELVVVTGASGNIGGDLVRRLLGAGIGVRAVARGNRALDLLVKAGAEAMPGDLAEPGFAARAFAGASRVWAMIPPNYGAPDFRAYQRQVGDNLARGLAEARVGEVVLLSSVGAHLPSGNGPIAGLHDLEQRLGGMAGLRVVSLRPTFFMENHLLAIGLIKSQGMNGGAFRPDLPLAMVATRDIAAVAAEYLAGPLPAGFTVRELLGPRDYSHAEVTRILGTAIGRPALGYVQFPYAAVEQTMIGLGLSPSAASLMVEMSEGFNSGRVQPTQPRSPSTTTPTTLEDFAREVFAPAYQGA